MRSLAMLRNRPLAAFAAALVLASCASIREVERTPFEGEGGAVRVRVFADDDAQEAGRLFGGALVGTLERQDGRRWRPVFRSLDSSWTVAGLEPGTYRVTFADRLDDGGEIEGLERPIAESVRVRSGEVAEVVAVLDHVSPAMIAAGAVGIVVAAVLLHEWLDDLDLPVPPPPPPHWVAETVFWVALDVASAAEARPHWTPRPAGPVVTSHFPERGARVAARRVRIVFALSAPLDETTVAPDAVTVTTAGGERLPGRARYDARRWWIVWEPESDLPAGADLEARLEARGVAGEDGAPLEGGVTFGFSTP
jgi:hypothetical protein